MSFDSISPSTREPWSKVCSIEGSHKFLVDSNWSHLTHCLPVNSFDRSQAISDRVGECTMRIQSASAA